MKSITIITFTLVIAIASVSCSSDTDLSEEEIKAANEAMKYNNPYQWNNWPQNTWNNGMHGTKRIQFGKDLPSVNTDFFDHTGKMIVEKK